MLFFVFSKLSDGTCAHNGQFPPLDAVLVVRPVGSDRQSVNCNVKKEKKSDCCLCQLLQVPA